MQATTDPNLPGVDADADAAEREHALRHLDASLFGTFGGDAFGRLAERIARAFGTPRYIVGQTIVVLIWILLNVVAVVGQWDAYPFILLNLAFSLQAAYAAPLILLAQTRQAERDKMHAEADAHHREDIAKASAERESYASQEIALLHRLLGENTELTRQNATLTAQVAKLTEEIHQHVAE